MTYRQVSIPKDLLDRITDLLENNKGLGYVSVSDFVRDAIREKLEFFERRIEIVQ